MERTVVPPSLNGDTVLLPKTVLPSNTTILFSDADIAPVTERQSLDGGLRQNEIALLVFPQFSIDFLEHKTLVSTRMSFANMCTSKRRLLIAPKDF